MPAVVLQLPVSAYQATLHLDDEALYVLTGQAAYRIAPGRPVEELRFDLSYGATATMYSYLFWSKGAIWNAPKRGGKPRKLAVVAHQPQFFASSGGNFAWVDRSDEGRFTIQTLREQKAFTTYESPGAIDVMGMMDNWVFFADRAGPSGWRLGGVPVTGGTPTFSAPRTGNSPAMLAIWKDIYYFDINTRDVRMVSPDLRHEETLLHDFVCSPIAVAERFYCAQLDGLFELVGKEHSPRQVAEVDRRPITYLAARGNTVAWLSDVGPDQLAVRMLRRAEGD